jgi:predicted dehydrogenase
MASECALTGANFPEQLSAVMPPSDAILIVGCGSIGERHLRCFQRTGRARVSACDANAALLECVARQYDVQSFRDMNAALAAASYDGIVICTPAQTHLDLALLGMAHGAG